MVTEQHATVATPFVARDKSAVTRHTSKLEVIKHHRRRFKKTPFISYRSKATVHQPS